MRFFILLLFGFIIHPVYAATQVDIYKIDLAVQSTEPDLVEQTRINGMKEVLIRASGDLNVTDNAEVKLALADAENYLTQFGFIDVNGQRTLHMEFDAKLIRDLLTKSHLALWPAQRPNVLVWLIEDKDYQRTIHWENVDSSEISQLKQAAQYRGVPITIPVGDFQDVTSVRVSDLWAGFVRPTSIASQRYRPDAVLIIRDQGQSASWTLFDQTPEAMVNVQTTPKTGQVVGATRLQHIIDTVTQYYAAKNSLVVQGESSDSTLVQVDNLSGPIEFFAAEKALKSLNTMASVDVVKIGDLYAVYRLHLLASREEFENEVAGHPHLVFDEQESRAQNRVANTSVMLKSDMTAPDNNQSQDAAMVIRKPIPVNPDLIFHWQ